MPAPMLQSKPELPPPSRSALLRAGVTVAAVLLVAADVFEHHTAVEKVLGVVLLGVLARITVTDLEERKIPNSTLLPAGVAAILIGLVMHPSGVPAQAAAGIGAGLFLLFFAVISKGGLGMGDVKLGLVMGLYLSRSVVVALVVGLLASAVFGLFVIARLGVAKGRKTPIPLGPFLALGGAVAVLFGPAITAHWGA